MKRTYIPIIIVAIIILAGAAAIFLKRPGDPAVVGTPNTPTTPVSVVPPPPAKPVTKEVSKNPLNNGHLSTEDDVQGQGVQVRQIVYNGAVFAPENLIVKVGDIVVFKNNGTKAFRPASDPHPTHTDYPEFDAKEDIAPGSLFQFKFTKVGTWKFHDHKNPSATGSVVVTQ